jgi:hypothetical protein
MAYLIPLRTDASFYRGSEAGTSCPVDRTIQAEARQTRYKEYENQAQGSHHNLTMSHKLYNILFDSHK